MDKYRHVSLHMRFMVHHNSLRVLLTQKQKKMGVPACAAEVGWDKIWTINTLNLASGVLSFIWRKTPILTPNKGLIEIFIEANTESIIDNFIQKRKKNLTGAASSWHKLEEPVQLFSHCCNYYMARPVLPDLHLPFSNSSLKGVHKKEHLAKHSSKLVLVLSNYHNWLLLIWIIQKVQI